MTDDGNSARHAGQGGPRGNASANVIEAARRYIAEGWAIVAVQLVMGTNTKVPIGQLFSGEATGLDWQGPLIGKETDPATGEVIVKRRAWTEDEIVKRLTGDYGCIAIGMLGGPLNNNLLIIDFDDPNGDIWHRQTCLEKELDPDDCILADTPGHEFLANGSRPGGLHRYYTDPTGELGNSEGELAKHGINVRGRGGFVVAPPSPHPLGGTYCWRDDHSPDDYLNGPPPIPDHLRDAILADKIPMNGTAMLTPPEKVPPWRAIPYGETVFRNETDRLARTKKGNRNNQLNKSALKCGHHFWTNAYSEEDVRREFEVACRCNGYLSANGEHSLKDFIGSFRSGWKDGIAKPQPIPERRKTETSTMYDTWPPLDRSLLDASIPIPPFPIDLMPGRWRDWITKSAKAANSPITMWP